MLDFNQLNIASLQKINCFATLHLLWHPAVGESERLSDLVNKSSEVALRPMLMFYRRGFCLYITDSEWKWDITCSKILCCSHCISLFPTFWISEQKRATDSRTVFWKHVDSDFKTQVFEMILQHMTRSVCIHLFIPLPVHEILYFKLEILGLSLRIVSPWIQLQVKTVHGLISPNQKKPHAI